MSAFTYPDELSQDDSVVLPPPRAGYNPIAVTGLNNDENTELLDDEVDEFTQTQGPNNNKENVEANKKSSDLATNKRWPQYSNLCRDYPSLAKRLLMAVDETDAVHEVKARDTPNIKENKWAHLHFVTFGGDRGSLVGVLPMVVKATDLKKKVVEIWKHCSANEDDTRLDAVLLSMAGRQYETYLKTVEADVKGREDNKKRQEALQKSMATYERQQGAIPPGAKEVGAGRVNHSTNLRIAQPSSTGWVMNPEGQPKSPPRTPKTPASSSGKSSLTNESAVKECSGFQQDFRMLVDRIPLPGANRKDDQKDDDSIENELSEEDKKKLKALKRQRKRAMKKVNDYKPHIESDSNAKKQYKKSLKIIGSLDTKIDALLGFDFNLMDTDSSRTTLN